jgi:hypothetical protein
MTDIVALKSANAKRWANARLTRNLSSVAKSLVAAKPRYQAVETKTGVPWFVIAVIHERDPVRTGLQASRRVIPGTGSRFTSPRGVAPSGPGKRPRSTRW